jgi:hypothetical protein
MHVHKLGIRPAIFNIRTHHNLDQNLSVLLKTLPSPKCEKQTVTISRSLW